MMPPIRTPQINQRISDTTSALLDSIEAVEAAYVGEVKIKAMNETTTPAKRSEVSRIKYGFRISNCVLQLRTEVPIVGYWVLSGSSLASDVMSASRVGAIERPKGGPGSP
jgi:hypothetical protein